jgi:flagellar hook-length control protein FliK
MSGAGGGEMRIKMNPGNLGELMIRVSTDGKDVGLKVQANDPAAKKVIEESLSSLRDSLASQNLALGRVDVTLAPASTNSDFGQNSQQQSSNGQHAFAGFDGQQSPNQQRAMDSFLGQDGSSSSRSAYGGSDRAVPRGASSRIAAMGSTGASARAAASSRLDVMA